MRSGWQKGVVREPAFSDEDGSGVSEEEESGDEAWERKVGRRRKEEAWLDRYVKPLSLGEEMGQLGETVPVGSRRDQVQEETLWLLGILFPGWGKAEKEAAEQLLEKVFKEGDEAWDEERARKAGEDFSFPEEAVQEDLEEFVRCKRSLSLLAKERMRKLATERLSVERIERMVRREDDVADYERLMRLATVGMEFNLPGQFVSSGIEKGPKLNSKYKDGLHTAVDRMFYEKFWQRGMAVLLSKQVAAEIKDMHLSLVQWARKEDCDAGRPITNFTGKGRGVPLAVNNDHSKAACKEQWGEIKHPQLEDFVGDIWRLLDKERLAGGTRKLEDIVMYGLDFKAAFTQLWFAPKDVRFTGLETKQGLILFILCGAFGWTGTPAAFQVIVRVVIRGVKGQLLGLLKMFADDFHGTCFRSDVEHDMAAVKAFVRGLMGDGALEDKKELVATRKDIIGFHIDLVARLVSVKDRNARRALYGFMEVDLGKAIPVTTLERLAAWGARYARICCFMSPLVKTLNKARMGRRRAVSVVVSKQCETVIRVFRALLLGMALRHVRLVKPLWLFRNDFEDRSVWDSGQVVVSFDASLKGVGCVWSEVVPGWGEVQVGYGAWDLTPMGFGDTADYQNLCEFIGAVLGVVGARRLGLEVKGVILRGDSKTALTWAGSQHFRSELVQPAAMVFVSVLSGMEASVAHTQWVAGESNVQCDDLSRGRGFKEAKEGPGSGGRLNGVMRDVARELGDVSDLLGLLAPVQDWGSEEGFKKFWSGVQGWLEGELGVLGRRVVLDEKFIEEVPSCI